MADERFSDEELAAAERTARLLSALCDTHGMANGGTAARQQAAACRREIALRAKAKAE
jgi:hypothetical protein